MGNLIESYKRESVPWPLEKESNSGLLYENRGLLNHAHQSKFGMAYILFLKVEYGVNQITVTKLNRVGTPSALDRKFQALIKILGHS